MNIPVLNSIIIKHQRKLKKFSKDLVYRQIIRDIIKDIVIIDIKFSTVIGAFSSLSSSWISPKFVLIVALVIVFSIFFFIPWKNLTKNSYHPMTTGNFGGTQMIEMLLNF